METLAVKGSNSPADLWGGGGGVVYAPPPQECDPLRTQRVPPLYYFEISIFGDGPYNFSQGAFGRQCNTNFFVGGGGGDFLFKFSKTCLKTLFWHVFSKFCLCAENLVKIGSLQWFRRAQKINLVDLKKWRQIFFRNLKKKSAPTPGKNPRSASDRIYEGFEHQPKWKKFELYSNL